MIGWIEDLTSYADIDSEELSSFLPLGYGLPSIVTTPLAHENPKYLEGKKLELENVRNMMIQLIL